MKTLSAVGALWQRLAVRERRLVSVALAVVLCALTWGLGIAPALGTLRAAPARLVQLDRQLESMRSLAAQAQELQARPPVRREDALRTLQSSLEQRLGKQARLGNAGDRVTVTLSGVAPELLAQWLGQARSTARVVVQQARLTRAPEGWDGSIVLLLPAQ
jgi:general secretion pathway protein M